MNQQCAGPSTLYPFHPAINGTQIPTRAHHSPPYPNDLPQTPNRECEAVPEQWFPIERGLSARGREKQREGAGSWSAENASAPEGVNAGISGERYEEEQKGRKLEEERKMRERTQVFDLAGEVDKVVRKVYHLSEPGREKEKEKEREVREREDDASTTAVARSEQERESIAIKPEDVIQTHPNSHVSQRADTCDFRNVATLSTSSTYPHDPVAKQQAIEAWITDVHQQTGGKCGLSVPSWAAKVGVAPSEPDSNNGYEETLVGDEVNYPTKLPDDENPEDQVERISLTAEIPMGAWIVELVRRAAVGVSQLKVAACYLIALNPTIQALMDARRKAAASIAAGLPVEQYINSPLLCARRTLVSCLIIASKFLGDNVYTIKAWARITGIEAPDLVQCEAAIGVSLGWRMWVGANVQSLKNDVFTRTLAQLKVPMPPPPALVVPQEHALPQPAPQGPSAVTPQSSTGPAVPAAPTPVSLPALPAKEKTVTRKRSRALLGSGSSTDATVRAGKRKAIERFPMARGTSTGCATSFVSVMPEQVDEPRPMAEAY